jgi:hypothetical protein
VTRREARKLEVLVSQLHEVLVGPAVTTARFVDADRSEPVPHAVVVAAAQAGEVHVVVRAVVPVIVAPVVPDDAVRFVADRIPPRDHPHERFLLSRTGRALGQDGDTREEGHAHQRKYKEWPFRVHSDPQGEYKAPAARPVREAAGAMTLRGICKSERHYLMRATFVKA